MPFKRPAYPAHYRLSAPKKPISRTTTDILAHLPPSAPPPPPYPYGAAQWFKQSDRGLYGGATKLYGNNVSSKLTTKTRRTWYPNIQMKRIYSRALERFVRLRVTTRTLRTIDKVGGIDEYVLGRTPARVRELGPVGWELRWVILHSRGMRERMEGDQGLRRLVEGTEDRDYEREEWKERVTRRVMKAEIERLEAEELEEMYEDENEYDPRQGAVLVGGRGKMGEGHMAEEVQPKLSRWERLKRLVRN